MCTLQHSIGCPAATIAVSCTPITTAPSGSYIVTFLGQQSAFLGIAVACPYTKVTVTCFITGNGATITANTVSPGARHRSGGLYFIVT